MSKLTIDPRGVRLLLVDGDVVRRDDIASLLTGCGYGVIVAASAAGLDARIDQPPDLVILDLDAPGMSADMLTAAGRTIAAPILGLTSDGSDTGRRRAATVGVDDFAIRPFSDEELRLRLDNALANGRLRRLLNERSERLTESLRERTAELDTVRESLSVLAAMADYHDDDTDQHAQRVGIVAAAIARQLALPDPFVTMLRDAAALHDIGKVGISRRILLKPDKLTPSEWLHMQHHVEIGARILASARSSVLILAAEVARTHHERYDGSGYTAGLSGEEIPLAGRIVAVADVWDTLTRDRPYRPAWEPERAQAEIHAQAGSHFDPMVVAAFAALDPRALELGGDGVQRAA